MNDKVKDKIQKIKDRYSEISNIVTDTGNITKSGCEPLKRVERLNKCTICLDYGKFENVMIARQCGHGVFCQECVAKSNLSRCPLCRVDTSFVKLFI